MESIAPSRPQLIQAIEALPPDVLPELANFLSYLQYKATQPIEQVPLKSGSEFLLSITALGQAEPTLSERNEEILAQEIDPIRGLTLTPTDE